jgi:hypothetical protein
MPYTDEELQRRRETYATEHKTNNEKYFIKRWILPRGLGEQYRQANKKNRVVWEDAYGTRINKNTIFSFLEQVLGPDPYAEDKT